MSEVTITVRGEHETRVPPEEAVAHLSVRAEGPERGAVVERIAALAAPLRDDLDDAQGCRGRHRLVEPARLGLGQPPVEQRGQAARPRALRLGRDHCDLHRLRRPVVVDQRRRRARRRAGRRRDLAAHPGHGEGDGGGCRCAGRARSPSTAPPRTPRAIGLASRHAARDRRPRPAHATPSPGPAPAPQDDAGDGDGSDGLRAVRPRWSCSPKTSSSRQPSRPASPHADPCLLTLDSRRRRP